MGPHLEIKKEEHRKEEMCVEMAGWYLLEGGNMRRLETREDEIGTSKSDGWVG